MKKYVKMFLLRGATGIGIGNIIAMLISVVIAVTSENSTISVYDYAVWTAASSVIGFVFGGLNVVFEIERLSLLKATLIHYFVMLLTFYACAIPAGWYPFSFVPILISVCIFTGSYVVIWIITYLIIRHNAKRMTDALNRK